MVKDIPVTFITLVVGLLLVAALSAILFRRLKFPYTIGLVLVGIGLGALASRMPSLAPLTKVHLTPNIILYVLLPTLIFEAAVNIDGRLLMRNLVPVLSLAAPGLVIAMLITGGLVTLFTPLPLGAAMVFGALISATDPVAVIALFKELGAPKRLTMLVDGESLFNDATSIVTFEIMQGLVLGGVLTASVLLDAHVKFITVFFGGFLMGAVIGWIMVRIISMAKSDPLIEIAVTTVVAYAAFIFAQYYFDLSGVMAVVGAGIVVSFYGTTRLSRQVRQYMNDFWEYAAFAANSFIFIMLGFTEDYLFRSIAHGWSLLAYILAAVLAVMIARAVVVFGLVPVVNRVPHAHRIDRRNQGVMFWGGLRGALPIGLAVSLPLDFPARRLIIELTLGVVLFTLLVQGTTISWLMHRLRLDRPSPHENLARQRALVAARRAALRRIQNLAREWVALPADMLSSFIARLEQAVSHAESDLGALQQETAEQEVSQSGLLWKEVVNCENDVFQTLCEHGFIEEPVMRELEHNLRCIQEQVRVGKVPDLYVPTLPFFARIQAVWVRAVTRGILAKRMNAHVRIAKYQRDSALADAGAEVLKRLDSLAELCSAEPDVQQACRDFYRKRYDQALCRLQAMEKAHPGFMHALQRYELERTALDAEATALEEMAANGAISRAAAEEMSQPVFSQMKQIDHQYNTDTVQQGITNKTDWESETDEKKHS